MMSTTQRVLSAIAATVLVASTALAAKAPRGSFAAFEARAKVSGLAAQSMPRGSGGGLSLSGHMRRNNLQGDKDRTRLEEEFDIPADRPVHLFCELRANKGEIWFDLNSLKLERLK